jgi:polysaccharide export outer membrane protein
MKRTSAAVLASLALTLMLRADVAVAAVKGDYTVGPGDALVVQVFGDKDMTGEYKVGPSGSIAMPVLGAIDVSGLSVDQVTARIKGELGKIVRNPVVVVTINELDSERKVYVGGQVEKPGPFALPFGSTVLDAAIAAGLLPTADLSQVTLTRPGQAPQVLDLSGWRTAQGVALAELVRYGDTVFIPELTDRIAVVGAVTNPAQLVPTIGKHMYVLDALSAAKGLLPTADPAHATVLHKAGAATQISLEKLLDDGDMTQNVELRPGDVLVVREAKRIAVVGQVTTPTSFVANKPLPVLSALAQGGQVLPEGDLEHAKIVGPDGSREVDLKALTEKGEKAATLEISPGETLVIPEAPEEEVLLAGAVQHPGPVDIRKLKQRDILRLITSVGLTPAGDPTRVVVLRGEKQITVDYQAILKDDATDQNIDVLPGDTIYVPDLQKVYVIGAVASGGAALPCQDSGMKILDALVQSGGLNPNADPNQIHIVRPRPDGTTEHVQLRMGDVQKGKLPSLITLKPGDIVYVALKGKPFTWQDIASVLWTASSLKTIFGW